jgi:Tol biopolymer transport system component
MKKYYSKITTGYYRIIFAALIFASISVLLFVSTGTGDARANSLKQNLFLGKLAFQRLDLTVGSPISRIQIANADGTGQFTVTPSFPPTYQGDWSPDGTKIIFGMNQDIYVVNADGTNQVNISNTQSVNELNPSWSATGKIAYERDNQIWVMNADGTNQMQFPGITQPAPTVPAWSADGGKIAFVSGGEIWTINADGTNEQRVTMSATNDNFPSWSPDGAKIVFAKGASGIAVVNADGTNEMNLTNNSTDAEPDWSPDGTTIAFRRGGSEGGIYLMNAGGADQVRIIADTPGSTGSLHREPVWQPVAQTPNTFSINGRITQNGASLSGVIINLSGTTNAVTTTDAVGNYQISGLPAGGSYMISPSLPGYYFTPPNRSFNNLTSNQAGSFAAAQVCRSTICAKNGKIAYVGGSGVEIWTMNPDGTNRTQLTTNGAGFTDAPNYSPDGSAVVYQTSRDGNYEIYRINADGSNQIRLTNNAAADTTPYYSPDGASIVFVSDRDGNEEIYKMNADGSNPVRLTNDAARDASPAFSPNGQKIIFVTARLGNNSNLRLFTMNADGSNQQVISNVQGFYGRPSYSPDGQKIIFAYGTDVMTQKIWTMNADGTNRAQIANGLMNPSYSPDGTKIIYYLFAGAGTAGGIYSANADGSSPLQLISTNENFSDWQPILAPRRAAFDFDGDGRSDISVFRQTDTVWYLLRSQTGFTSVQWGLSDDTLAPADYDGDGRADAAIFRSGAWYVLKTQSGATEITNFGIGGDAPVPSAYVR